MVGRLVVAEVDAELALEWQTSETANVEQGQDSVVDFRVLRISRVDAAGKQTRPI